jgi:hypothetical protein
VLRSYGSTTRETDSFPRVQEVSKLYRNENWLKYFEEQNVQFVILSQSQDKKLVKTLRRQPGWSVDFEGDGAVIFTRSAQKGKGQ